MIIGNEDQRAVDVAPARVHLVGEERHAERQQHRVRQRADDVDDRVDGAAPHLGERQKRRSKFSSPTNTLGLKGSRFHW
jgi:hypothetical protein